MDQLDPREWQVPQQCIPVHANVTLFDWGPLASACQFDVIMMDPPWQLATANPTRGVSLSYSQLTDDSIANLPVRQLQTNGLLFVWVINAKYEWTLSQFKKWGYTFVDEIEVYRGDPDWVKLPFNGEGVTDAKAYHLHAVFEQRIRKDILAVREAAAKLKAEAREKVAAELDAVERELPSMSRRHDPKARVTLPLKTRQNPLAML